MRSLVLRAGTVAGVVAVLALPAATAQAASRASTAGTATSTSATTASSSSATTGRIVSGEALAASFAVASPASSTSVGPLVQRRPLDTGTTLTGYAEATS